MVLSLTFALLAGGAHGASPAPPQAGDAAVPKAARKLLDEKWKGWRLASLDPQATSCHMDGQFAPVVQADLDGDGRPDVAVAVTTAKGVRLAAIFNRQHDSVLQDIDAIGDTAAAGWIDAARRGTKFRRAGSTVDDYFSTDTLIVKPCSGPRTAYFWTGLGFSKQTLE